MERLCSVFISRDNIDIKDFNIDHTYNEFKKLPRKTTIMNNYNKRTAKIIDYDTKYMKEQNFDIKNYPDLVKEVEDTFSSAYIKQ